MFKDDAATISNVGREDENLADLVEEIATSALRGVQLDVRSVYCILYCKAEFGIRYSKDSGSGSKFCNVGSDLPQPGSLKQFYILSRSIGVEQKTSKEIDKSDKKKRRKRTDRILRYEDKYKYC